MVLKYNANQRYATTAITASVIREVAAKCGVPLQVNSITLDCSIKFTFSQEVETPRVKFKVEGVGGGWGTP